MREATSPIVARAFGDVIHGARRRRNLEPATVAARGQIGLADLRKLEHGQVEPSLSLLIRSALGLAVSPVWLIEEVLSWLNFSKGTDAATDLAARRARMSGVGSAFTSTLLGSSEQELASTVAVGERLINEFAKRGLVIIPLARAVESQK
jgi:transcriptional regulator with XRE-family HTH domain